MHLKVMFNSTNIQIKIPTYFPFLSTIQSPVKKLRPMFEGINPDLPRMSYGIRVNKPSISQGIVLVAVAPHIFSVG